MKEDQIVFQISRIISAARSFTAALDEIRALLGESLGARALTTSLPSRSASTSVINTQVEEVLNALDAPYRSLYSVPLRSGGRELGKLIACYASREFQGAVPQRVSEYAGEQLGMLLQRIQLTCDRERLAAELAQLREALAARKLLQRAGGILSVRRGISPAAANVWISQEARRSALPLRKVAEQIVAGEIAERNAVFAPRQGRTA